jgi:hypothetical protein
MQVSKRGPKNGDKRKQVTKGRRRVERTKTMLYFIVTVTVPRKAVFVKKESLRTMFQRNRFIMKFLKHQVLVRAKILSMGNLEKILFSN